MSDAVLFEIKDRVAWATLNRPKSLNAVNEAMVDALLAIVAQVAADPEVRVLVLTGAGRAFCAGGDIFEMADAYGEAVRPFQRKIQRLSHEMRDLDKPILAAVNGYALGAGIELALMCDLRVAAETAKFGVPDAHLGISPGGGMTFLMPETIGIGRTMDMALQADPIEAQEADRIGLVTQIEPDQALLENVHALAVRIASFPPKGLAYMKRGYYMASEATFASTLKVEEEYDVGSFRSPETQRELQAFLASRAERKAHKDGASS
jgi:enoyl-CoA hydratase/carnithine racemase